MPDKSQAGLYSSLTWWSSYLKLTILALEAGPSLTKSKAPSPEKTAIALSAIKATLVDLRSRIVAVEKVLKEVE